MEKLYNEYSNQKMVEIAILISYKISFKAKKVIRKKKDIS